jgi:hypothetical protein
MEIFKLVLACCVFIMLTSISTIIAGDSEFNEISGENLISKMNDSINHSLISYWFVGEKDGFYYLIEKRRPYEENRKYRVNTKYVEIYPDKDIEFSMVEENWLNIKYRGVNKRRVRFTLRNDIKYKKIGLGPRKTQ